MDNDRKKQLIQEYRNRRPEMGVISLYCKPTGESFLGISKDTRADFNGNQCRLDSGSHPNRRLQALWNEHGMQNFEFSVVKRLNYEDPAADHTAKLEELRENCLAHIPNSMKIWK